MKLYNSSNKRKLKSWIMTGLLNAIKERDMIGKLTFKRQNDFRLLNYQKKI